ncbi:MAG: family 43 glycosylhydrolase [Ruminococcus sp.]|nr:family 43 glycosylhydrolase [Ruminococcus sp.]
MNGKMKAFIAACACGAVAAASAITAAPTAFAETVTVNNPVIWSDVPDDDVIRVGDTYYMVSTTMFFSPGAPIMKSHDLVSWEICNYVYDTLADGDVQNLTNGKNDYAHGQWAASLRYHDGMYYVFFGSYGTGKSYIYKTNDIENGTWTRSEINGMYHDASILFDDDGRNYLVYGGGGEIKIKELNSEMTGFKWGGVEKTLFKTGLTGLAGEGSHIQKIGDYYYVFIIAWPNGSGRTEYCYRSKDLLGNYEGKVVLNSGLGTYGSGVAQGGIVDTPDGKWYGMLFQDHGAVGRIPVLVPVSWQNGWPMMGVNGKAPLTLDIDTDFTGTQLAKDDDFSYSANQLALEWQWNHNPDNSAWSVTDRPGWLRLKNKSTASHILNARNTLTMRTEGPSCSSVIKLDSSGMKPGDRAGLSAFQLKFGNIGVIVSDNGSKAVYMAVNGGNDVPGTSEKIVAQAPMQGDEVYLKAEFKYNNVNSDGSASNNIDKADFYYSFDGNNWTKLGDTLSMSYDLKLFTGYRSAIYSYGTKNTGGYADIDFFDYERAEWNPPVVTEPDPDGYIFHNKFDSASEGWSGRGAAKVSVSTSESYAGDASLYCTDRTASWNGAVRSLGRNFKAGESYSFSTVVKYTEGNPTEQFALTLQYKGTDGEVHYDKIDIKTAVKGEWVQLANTSYTIPEGAADLQFYVETIKNECSFYVDEAIGAPDGTVIDGPKAVNIIKGDLDFDGKINVFDLVAAKESLAAANVNNNIAAAGDVNSDGMFNISDALLLEKYVLGAIDSFDSAVSEDDTPVTQKLSMADFTAKIAANIVENEPNESHQQVAGVSYGEIKSGEYYSTTCNRTKKYNVLLPAGYSESKKYPVLYVLHGYWENPDRMIIKGNGVMATREIVGNAIASGEAKDMILVFPDVYSSATQAGCSAMDEPNNQAYDNFLNDFTRDLMPHIEKTYSVLTGRENTAVTGFSMGGRESLNIGMKLADKVSYVGAVCPAPGASGDFKWTGEYCPDLVFITAGGNDKTVYTVPSGYHDSFTKNNVPHVWHYVKNGYHGDNSIHAHLYNFVRAVFQN